MKRKVIGLIAAVMLLVALTVIPAVAQPPICTWTGLATFDGSAVAVGTTIKAKVGTTVVGTATATAVAAGENYNMPIPQVDGVPGEGATVNFYVVISSVEYLGGTSTWNAGGLKSLNLAAVSGPSYTLTIAISPAGGGTTNPAAGPHTYSEGTAVTITATPASGYRFVNWTGDASGTSTSVTVTMNAAKSVTANFIAVYTLTTSVSPSGTGSVTKSPSATQYDAGTVVTLTGVASSGYRFNNWSGDASGTANPTTVTMSSNKSVTANFVESRLPVLLWWITTL